jgi:putative chitinase
MSNIVGEGFPKEIIKQIDVRQKVYGSANRTNEQLSYLEARTGWVKLVSSVNVDAPIRNIPYVGGELASRFVLFNGTTNESPTRGALETYQRGGIWPGGNANENNYAYGIGGIDYGLRPMPGIQSATIKTETRGSIKTAEVKLQANNRQQFDIIDILYMRLGFSMLLEWGNSSYFDNDGKYIKDNPNSLADEFLLGKLGYDTIYNTIQEKRLASCGNYDALIGKVVNFSWNFTKDLTYEITLKIISMGDVIESLKTNALLPGGSLDTSSTTPITGSTPPSPTPETVIKDFANVHEIGKMFYQYQQKLAPLGSGKDGISTIIESNLEYSGRDSGDSVSFFKQVYQDKGSTQYYVKLGWFLKWIEKNLIYKVKTNNATVNKQVKLLKINNKVKENIIYLLGRQISTDPGVCLFKTKFKFTTPSDFVQFANDADEFYAPSVNKNRYGYIMNSYFNIAWILTQMESLKDKDGKVPLFSLLECLCKGWNSATGNFNKLAPVVDSETNEIKFVDEVILPDRKSFLDQLGKSTELAYFNVQGYYFDPSGSSTGGFIRDINFTTTVPPNLATMITVGATSKGYVVGQDATALSRMNAGLTDRFKPEIDTEQALLNAVPSSGSLLQDYKAQINAFNTFLRELGSEQGIKYPKWNQEAITAFSNAAVTFYEYDQASQTQAAQTEREANGNLKNPYAASPNAGFLPFDLSIKMDGLSGMKVYQKYTIDTTYLPSNYPNSLEFIIKSINNTIDSNQWTTTLESMAIPRNPFGSSIAEGPVEQASRNASRGTQASPTSADKQRIIEKIIAFARSKGITDKERLTAILATAKAESNFNPSIVESFNYSLDSAKRVFPSYFRGMTDAQILQYIPISKGGSGSQEKLANFLYGNRYGNGPNEGYKYAGKGLVQITFKSNYEAMAKKLKYYGYEKWDIVTNPEYLNEEDTAIAVLVIGKLPNPGGKDTIKGLSPGKSSFGLQLKPGFQGYLTDGLEVQATQNGGQRIVNSVTAGYTAAIYSINNTKYIQDLIA